mmetsp:Transcript_32835/g.101744  ORF Transcript_32835/g.101744 Transcript_32835/m.101744 type:complete len:81 (+) Transcript_32835:229-471(+)
MRTKVDVFWRQRGKEASSATQMHALGEVQYRKRALYEVGIHSMSILKKAVDGLECECFNFDRLWFRLWGCNCSTGTYPAY